VRASGRPADVVVIQERGGTRSTIEQGRRWVEEARRALEDTPRGPLAAHELVVGTVCGGSDGTSGITANPAIGRAFDRLVAEDAVCYPWDEEIETEELAGEKAYRLLRIGRGRAVNREVCGGMRLEHGYLKLASHDAEYLVARRGEALVGAAGYVHDPIDEKVRLFELIATDDPTKGTLVRRFLEHVTERYSPAYVQADVNAHSPRMQAALAQLGFFPVGYCPAMVFEDVERLDVVKMVKLYTPWALGQLDLVPEAAQMKALVERAFVEQNKGRTICDLARHVHIFQGLGDEEIAAIRSVCHERRHEAGEVVFEAGAPSKALYIIVSGTVAIVVGEKADVVLAEIGEGQVFGEMALVDREPRSAGAVCTTACDLLVIDYADFHHAIQHHPEIGRKVLHNLARTLSRRLRDADRSLEWRGAPDRS